MSERPRLTSHKQDKAGGSRLLPLSIAGLICFALALVIGYGGWYLFGTHSPAARRSSPAPVSQTSTPVPPTPEATPTPVKLAPAGELPVPGGEVVLHGEDTGLPPRRELVGPFFIAETEVTNEQYREFVKAAGHKPPPGWKDGEFAPGATLEPVTDVTWNDANEYCKWLSGEIGAEVRLPSEAEWELAARGKEGYKYPWGKEWNKRAAESAETGGRVRAVKSFPAGKSPFGAYDMAGNVWEWVTDEFRDAEGRPKTTDGVTHRTIKGGSVKEGRAFISATSRYDVAADKSSARLGFRYVVVRRQ